MIRAIALDDEQPSLEILEAFCSEIDFIDLQKTFLKTSEATYYLENYPVDLIFLDINMPARSGIDFYKTISQDVAVVFTTAYKEYAIESYEIGAIDYLLKPFSFDRFKTTIDRVLEQKKLIAASNDNYIYFRVDYGLTKVMVQEITYIESLDNYIKIHFENKKPLLIRMTIKTILDKLPPKVFLRIHRSYIVSLSKIDSYKNKMVYINDEKIPLGTTYEKEFLERLKI